MSGHDHDHGAAARRAGARHVRPLALALLLTIGFLAVQIATGIVTGSLALLSDAGHMATDALGLGADSGRCYGRAGLVDAPGTGLLEAKGNSPF